MGVDGSGADAKLLGELPVCESARHPSQNFDLARGQAIRSGLPRHYCVRLDNVRMCEVPRQLLRIIAVKQRAQ